MVLYIILLIFSLIIFVINIIFLFLFPEFTKRKTECADYLNISVIIAFKNEDKNLASLFSSLGMLNYALNKYEVILVDDGSIDNSYQKAVELSHGKTNFRILRRENNKYPGKRGALDIGITNAKYQNILITDADCAPSSNWLIGYSEKFNSGYDMLFGIAPFNQKKGLINKISCFENLRGSILTFSFAKMGLPYSAAARNFGFTTTAYKKLKGFSNTLETASGDDDLLIREAFKNKLKIGVVEYEKSYVVSDSKSRIRDYLNQKARHTITSLHYLPIHQLLLGFWHSSNILLIFSLLLLPLNLLYGIPFLLKLFSDLIVISLTQRKFQYRFKLVEVPILQMIYEILLIVNFFSSFRKTIPWKN